MISFSSRVVYRCKDIDINTENNVINVIELYIIVTSVETSLLFVQNKINWIRFAIFVLSICVTMVKTWCFTECNTARVSSRPMLNRGNNEQDGTREGKKNQLLLIPEALKLC